MNKDKRDKRGKFIELAEKRVNKAINDLRLIKNLSNKNYYEFDDDQSQKIVKALQQEVEVIRKSFQESNANNKQFRL